MSLFGQPTRTSANSGPFGGTFGSGTGASATQNQSTLGSSSGASSGKLSGFGTVSDKSGTSMGGTLPTAVNSSNSSKLLKDLLESAHNLPKSDNHQLGSVHLTLRELQRKSEKLRKLEDSGKKDVNFTKAHYLLASSGISAEEIELELNNINLPASTTTSGSSVISVNSGAGGVSVGASSSYSNIENYLNAKKDENILNTIEQLLNLSLIHI